MNDQTNDRLTVAMERIGMVLGALYAGHMGDLEPGIEAGRHQVDVAMRDGDELDPAAPPEERAQRRRRLTKGPIEFREARVDQPKTKGK